jgi:hypothetical protein
LRARSTRSYALFHRLYAVDFVLLARSGEKRFANEIHFTLKNIFQKICEE